MRQRQLRRRLLLQFVVRRHLQRVRRRGERRHLHHDCRHAARVAELSEPVRLLGLRELRERLVRVDSDCATGRFCQSGACVAKLANGVACTTDTGCAKGNCVDGICCDTKCTGNCQACDVPGKLGISEQRRLGTAARDAQLRALCRVQSRSVRELLRHDRGLLHRLLQRIEVRRR